MKLRPMQDRVLVRRVAHQGSSGGFTKGKPSPAGGIDFVRSRVDRRSKGRRLLK